MRLICLLATAMTLLSSVAHAKDDVIIFLHNAWYEKNKSGQPHKKFGAYDFEGIKQAFAKGARVVAPDRGANADPKSESMAVIEEIKRLMAAGVAAQNIKVIGTSKGAFIAQLASAELNNPEIRWVVVGGCHTKRMQKGNVPAMTGKVLSIHENSDTVSSACAQFADLSKQAAKFEEVTLETGKNHGFQFVAGDEWIGPALNW